MPTRKKAPAPAPGGVEAPAPEVAAEPWNEAGWDLDAEDSSATQEP